MGNLTELAKSLELVERAGIDHSWIERVVIMATSLAKNIDDRAARASIALDVHELAAALEVVALTLLASGSQRVTDLPRS